jgi:hypothetical protein
MPGLYPTPLASGIQGAMEGYDFADRILSRQDDRDLREREMALREQEAGDMRQYRQGLIANNQLEQEANRMKLDQARREQAAVQIFGIVGDQSTGQLKPYDQWDQSSLNALVPVLNRYKIGNDLLTVNPKVNKEAPINRIIRDPNGNVAVMLNMADGTTAPMTENRTNPGDPGYEQDKPLVFDLPTLHAAIHSEISGEVTPSPKEIRKANQEREQENLKFRRDVFRDDRKGLNAMAREEVRGEYGLARERMKGDGKNTEFKFDPGRFEKAYEQSSSPPEKPADEFDTDAMGQYQAKLQKWKEGRKEALSEIQNLMRLNRLTMDEAISLRKPQNFFHGVDDEGKTRFPGQYVEGFLAQDENGQTRLYYTAVRDPKTGEDVTPKGGAKTGLIGAAMEKEGQDYGYGKRPDGTNKGKGYFGELKRPDGDISTELSVTVNLDGKDMDIPTIVPTLNKQEIDTLLSLKPDQKIPQSIIDKAKAHAKKRLAAGKSPFAGPGEEAKPPAAQGGLAAATSLSGNAEADRFLSGLSGNRSPGLASTADRTKQVLDEYQRQQLLEKVKKEVKPWR